jgi:glycosyltransferase involved in cell wall biosynthesis
VPMLDKLLLKIINIPYVLDYDDAIFHHYDQSKHALIKFLLGKKLLKLMSEAKIVIAGNAYLKVYAEKAGAKKVIFIPSLISLNDYEVKRSYLPKKNFIIGWVGSPSTQHYLNLLTPILQKLAKTYELELVTIGASPFEIAGVQVFCYPWSSTIQREKIKIFDLGVMPLYDAPWEKGKCAYKLLQYMAAGIPVLASAVGANNDVIHEGINGFLVNTEKEWEEKLIYLIENRDQLEKMGKNAYDIVKNNYSVQALGNFFVDTLLSCDLRK